MDTHRCGRLQRVCGDRADSGWVLLRIASPFNRCDNRLGQRLRTRLRSGAGRKTSEDFSRRGHGADLAWHADAVVHSLDSTAVAAFNGRVCPLDGDLLHLRSGLQPYFTAVDCATLRTFSLGDLRSGDFDSRRSIASVRADGIPRRLCKKYELVDPLHCRGRDHRRGDVGSDSGLSLAESWRDESLEFRCRADTCRHRRGDRAIGKSPGQVASITHGEVQRRRTGGIVRTFLRHCEQKRLFLRDTFPTSTELGPRTIRFAVKDPLTNQWQAIVDCAAPNARVIWRSGGLETDFVNRVRVEVGGSQVEMGHLLDYRPDLARALHERDRVQTYGSFHIAEFRRDSMMQTTGKRTTALSTQQGI